MTITSKWWSVRWDGLIPRGQWHVRGRVLMDGVVGYDARTNTLTRWVTYYVDNGTMAFRPGY